MILILFPLIFTCLMIIGGFAARVRILLEKDRQDTIFRKIRKIPENYIFPEDSGSQKEEARGARGQAHT
jgi:hypothetical protein